MNLEYLNKIKEDISTAQEVYDVRMAVKEKSDTLVFYINIPMVEYDLLIVGESKSPYDECKIIENILIPNQEEKND